MGSLAPPATPSRSSTLLPLHRWGTEAQRPSARLPRVAQAVWLPRRGSSGAFLGPGDSELLGSFLRGSSWSSSLLGACGSRSTPGQGDKTLLTHSSPAVQAGNRARPPVQPWWQVPAPAVWQPISGWDEASGADPRGRQGVHRNPGSGTLRGRAELRLGEKGTQRAARQTHGQKGSAQTRSAPGLPTVDSCPTQGPSSGLRGCRPVSPAAFIPSTSAEHFSAGRKRFVPAGETSPAQSFTRVFCVAAPDSKRGCTRGPLAALRGEGISLARGCLPGNSAPNHQTDDGFFKYVLLQRGPKPGFSRTPSGFVQLGCQLPRLSPAWDNSS